MIRLLKFVVVILVSLAVIFAIAIDGWNHPDTTVPMSEVEKAHLIHRLTEDQWRDSRIDRNNLSPEDHLELDTKFRINAGRFVEFTLKGRS
jgi:hypothetical protein